MRTSRAPERHGRRHGVVRRVAGSLFAVGALALVLSACDPNERTLVELSGPTTRNLGPGATPVARYPLRLAPGTKLRDLYPQPRLLDLRLDGESLPIGGRPLTVRKLDGLVLIIDVSKGGLSEVGTYEADIKIGSKQKTYQVLTVELVRRSAAVRAPAIVRIDNEVWFPELGWCVGLDLPWGGRIAGTCEPRTETFTVQLGQRAGVDRFTQTQLQATPGKVGLTSTAPKGGPALPAGESTALAYELTGDFPLTEVDRTVVLSSPQLEEPTSISFQVTTKRHPALIGIIIVIGGAIGALSRYLIPRLGERRQRRQAKRELAAQLRAAKDDTTDVAVRDELDDLLGRVDSVSDKDQGAMGALRAIESDWATLERGLDDRLEVALAGRNQLDAATGRTWTLPHARREDVDALRAQVRGPLDTAIDQRNATAAEAALAEANLQATALTETMRSWIADYRAALDQLALALGEASTGRARRVLALTQRALAVAVPEPDAGATPAAALLPELRAASSLLQVHRDLVAAAGLLVGAIEPAPDPASSSAPVDVAPSATDDDGFLSAAPARAAVARSGAASQAQMVATADATRSTQAALTTGIREPDEIDALLTIASAIAALRTQGLTLGGASATADDAAPPAPAPTEPAAPPPHRPTSAAHRAPDLLASFGDGLFSAGAFLVQGAVSLILAVIVGYTIFLGSWTGTFADMAAVLTWALGVDLSVNALVAYGRTLKDPGPVYAPAGTA